MSTSRAHSLISQKATQPRHHDVPPTHTAFPVSVPIPNKRKSFQDNSSLITANRELAFRQLTEQLWAEGESPPSTTAYSISARSRRSSAPASERGVEDDTTKSIGTEIIDWDDADLPDSGNRTRLFFFHYFTHTYSTHNNWYEFLPHPQRRRSIVRERDKFVFFLRSFR